MTILVPLPDVDFPHKRPVHLVFHPGEFTLPPASDWDGFEAEGIVVLSGLDEWAPSSSGDFKSREYPRLFGGTFVLSYSHSSDFQSIANILRIGIYTRLSMILEQSFLTSLGVELTFPPPPPPPQPPSLPPKEASDGASVVKSPPMDVPIPAVPETSQEKKSRHSALTRGLWSFISEKKDKFLHRSSKRDHSRDSRGSSPSNSPRNSPRLRPKELPGPRASSLDSPTFKGFLSVGGKSSNSGSSSPRPSADEPKASPPSTKIRNALFDDDPEYSQSQSQPSHHTNLSDHPLPPFQALVERLHLSGDIFSTSPQIRFPMPPLLLSLAEKEVVDPQRRLRGDERVGLDSLIGWEGKEAREARENREGNRDKDTDAKWRGMLGTSGFVKHQTLTVLRGIWVPSEDVEKEKSKEKEKEREKEKVDGKGTAAPEPANVKAPASQPVKSTLCTKNEWTTYRYYSPFRDEDISLGEFVLEWCDLGRMREPCGRTRGEGSNATTNTSSGVNTLSSTSSATSSSTATAYRDNREDLQCDERRALARMGSCWY